MYRGVNGQGGSACGERRDVIEGEAREAGGAQINLRMQCVESGTHQLRPVSLWAAPTTDRIPNQSMSFHHCLLFWHKLHLEQQVWRLPKLNSSKQCSFLKLMLRKCTAHKAGALFWATSFKPHMFANRKKNDPRLRGVQFQYIEMHPAWARGTSLICVKCGLATLNAQHPPSLRKQTN